MFPLVVCTTGKNVFQIVENMFPLLGKIIFKGKGSKILRVVKSVSNSWNYVSTTRKDSFSGKFTFFH